MNTGVSFMGAGAALAPPLNNFLFIIWGAKIGVKRALFDFFYCGLGRKLGKFAPPPHKYFQLLLIL